MSKYVLGLDLTNKLTALGLIPKGLNVTRVLIDIGVDEMVKITYETIVSDRKVTDMILEKVVNSSDELIANKAAHALKGNNHAESTKR